MNLYNQAILEWGGMGKEAYQTYDLVKECQTFVCVKNLSWIHVQGLKKET